MKTLIKAFLLITLLTGFMAPQCAQASGNNSDGTKDPDGQGQDQERGHKGKKHGHAE